MRRSPIVAALLLALLVPTVGCPNPPKKTDDGPGTERAPAARPARWAQPIEGKKGVPNLFQVTDGIYRSAQPEDAGFPVLKEMGIKTVVNLRTFHSDRDECREAGLAYEKITMQAWEAEDEEVIDFLRIAVDEGRHPILVHCQHGADRTGTVIAAYRIVVQGWSKEDAIEEMREGGYGFHEIWKNLVEYLTELDVEAMKRAVEK